MKVIWATISRSGSQFLLGLTISCLGSELHPQSRISGSRVEGYMDRDPSFTSLNEAGRPMDYFTEHGIVALKLEDPGRDRVGFELLKTFPQAKWLTSVRPLDAILTSHHNVLKWGHDEEYVLNSYKKTLELLEAVHEQKRLLAVSIAEPDRFDTATFARFFDSSPTRSLKKAAAEWTPTNDLKYQKAKWGEEFDGRPELPPNLSTLRSRIGWVVDAEKRYERLVTETWEYYS